MADVSNINSLKPVWPTRPDGRQKKKRSVEEKDDRKNKEPEENEDGESEGHFDEFA